MTEFGEVLPPLIVNITRSGIIRYAGAATDFNEIHFSDRYAQSLGLETVVAHGMWTMGVGLRVVTDWIADPNKIISYQVRFTKPVFVPDTDQGTEVKFSGQVVEVNSKIAKIAIEASTAYGEVLGAAIAEVKVD